MYSRFQPLEKFVNICYNSYKNYIWSLRKKRSRSMTVLVSKTIKEKSTKSKFNDEFENYLKNQCLKTTFNGIELETFTWYKKVLGLV